jgi:hypothetical protein
VGLNLNVRPETLTLPQERIRVTLEPISIANGLLNRTPTAQQLRERLGLHRTEKLLHSKGNSHKTEEAAYRMGEKSLPAIHLTRMNNQNLQQAQKAKLPKNQQPNEKMSK